jgi:hypothetical protein
MKNALHEAPVNEPWKLTIWSMKAGLGGSSASAVVWLLLKGQGWKLSGLIEISAGLGRPMKAGSRAICALGMLHKQ